IKDGSAPLRSTIVSFGNPAIWWVGIIAVGYTAVMARKKRDKYMSPVIVGEGRQYFPWILVTRVAFIYHYFTAVPFMILMIVYAIKNLLEDGIIKKSTVWLYLGVVLVLFVMYYPVLTGLEVKRTYVEMLKIFSTWVF
ncbi:MAG: phospholipid carrier-dependent glycosyltransferase, partial [Clostridiaceae bacterium]|nr:phospholipid carrier-dependent glycosyltransferase [Clostridiaceae bacterium]